jgi:polysaccharide biosynthesis transport protein
LKPLQSLKAHPRLALCVVVIVSIAGLPIAWNKGQAAYRSEATVYVAPRYVKNLAEDQELEFQSNSQYRQYVEQQTRTINRYDIVVEASKRLSSSEGLWQIEGETAAQAAKRLQMSLSIRTIPGTYLIAVGLEGENPIGLAQIVNTVVEVYLAKQKEEGVYASDARIENLMAERTRLVNEMAGKDSARLKLSNRLGVTAFNEGVTNPYDKLLIASQATFNAARHGRIEAEAQWNVFNRDSGDQVEQAEQALNAAVAVLIDGDKAYTSYKVSLDAQRSVLMAKIAQLGQAHPGRKSIQRQIRALEEERIRYAARLGRRYAETLTQERYTVFRQSLQIEGELRREVEEHSRKASWYAGYYNQGLHLNRETERVGSRLDAVEERIDFLMLESSAPGFVRLSSPAIDTDIPISGGRKKIFLMIVGLGVVLALAVPVAIDLFDPRIHAAVDLERLAGMPLLGWTLEHGERGTKTFAAEQERRLMVRLERDARLNGTCTVMFTGVKPGAGTSGMVLELARQLNASGVSALAVELNVFKPDPRYGDGQSRPGVAEVLAGTADLAQAICPASGDLPARIAVTAGDTGLEGQHGLPALFERLRQDYRLILIDAAPILLAADTELQVGLVDGTVVVVEAESVNRGEVRRALRVLEGLEPQAAGVVLNRVRAYDGGGYFGDLLKEHRSGIKNLAPKLLRPWSWG